jgi:hypothetical protein
VQENLIHEPVELIDDDLDFVAGGVIIGSDVNIADVDQYIKQVQIDSDYSMQTAANVSSVYQDAN